MAELENISNDIVEDDVGESTPDVHEQRALEMGWRPLEEFDGDEANFIDAKEFVRRKPLFDKIEHQSKEIKNVRKALEALQGHYTKVQQTEYNKALASLKEARQEAITDADGATFEKIDTEIKRVEKEASELSTARVDEVQELPAEFVNWTNRNSWYTSVSYMRAFADDLGPKLAKQGMSPSEVLKQVEKAVKQEFPNKFRNGNKDDAPDVENGTSRSTKTSSKDSYELNDQERKIMNTLINSKGRDGKPLMTKEQYIADLKSAKGQ